MSERSPIKQQSFLRFFRGKSQELVNITVSNTGSLAVAFFRLPKTLMEFSEELRRLNGNLESLSKKLPPEDTLTQGVEVLKDFRQILAPLLGWVVK